MNNSLASKSYTNKNEISHFKLPQKLTTALLLFLGLFSFLVLPRLSFSQAYAAGTTYFVALNGLDTNAGTQTAPFKTFAKAVSLAAPGTIINVRAGTYTEKLIVSKSGTVDLPIVIQSYPGEKAIIDLKGTTSSNVQITGNYVTVSGMELMNSNGYCVTLSGTHLTAKNLIVHDCFLHGIFTDKQYNTIESNKVYRASKKNSSLTSTSGWSSGIKVAVGGDHITIKKNTVYNNWGEGIALTRTINSEISQNTVYNNYGNNIYIDNSHDILVNRNFVYSTPNSGYEKSGNAAMGIGMGEEYYSGWGSQLARIKIFNNIVAGCYKAVTYYGAASGSGLDTVSIVNNTFWNTGSTVLSFTYSSAPTKNRSTRISNNIAYQASGKMTYTDYPVGLTFSNNNWSVKPATYASSTSDVIGTSGFLVAPVVSNAASFKLQSVSPLVAKGIAYSAVTTDYENKLRISTISPGYDIGAYEFAGTLSTTP